MGRNFVRRLGIGASARSAASAPFARSVASARSTRILALALLAILAASPARAASVTRTASFTYDPGTALLIQGVIEPNTPALRLESDYLYDAYGNLTSTSVSGGDIATSTDTTTFDALGQFVTGNTNAVGQSETTQYDPRYGALTSQTGPNGLTTTWSYDAFGRKVLEVRPDGTQTAFSYQYCNGVNGGTANCVPNGSYLIQSKPLAADGVTKNGPLTIVYFDELDREVGRETEAFQADGTMIAAITQYDDKGRVSAMSRPFLTNGATGQYASFNYDVLGRVVTATAPDGSTTSMAYHGLVTAQTNALGQTGTVTRNVRNEVVSVTDALNNTMLYAYDPFGNVVQVTDPVGNVYTASYDTRGRKTASNDPDLGAVSYGYDVLGELVSQTDAKGQTVTVSYDALGRMIQRVEPDMTSQWVYDAGAMGIGKLASTTVTAGPAAGYARSLTYDSLGRPTSAATTIDGTTYTFAAGYDANGRLTSVAYPSGFVARYGYTILGDPNRLLDNATGLVLWTANAIDAELHLTLQTAGNNVVTARTFDPQTGRLGAIQAAPSTTNPPPLGPAAVQDLGYSYDRLGNPLTRIDNDAGLVETFAYDALNRLTSATASNNAAPAKTFSYDGIGNILSKSDVGNYTYAPPGSPLPHAVTGISGGTISTTFTYDANGNQVSGLGRAIAYTSFDMPASITQGTRTISFTHDVDHQRFKQVAPEGTTLYFDEFGVHAELFGGSAPQWRDFLVAGGGTIGQRMLNADQSVVVRYLHRDLLGSIAALTDETGAVVERDSYDSWGKRRFPNGADDPTGSITSQTTRGFTGEEELSVGSLVHLNGRVYDSFLGRMISADTVVPDTYDGQSFNRYSYVNNRPLSAADPTGHQSVELPEIEVIANLPLTICSGCGVGLGGFGNTICTADCGGAGPGPFQSLPGPPPLTPKGIVLLEPGLSLTQQGVALQAQMNAQAADARAASLAAVASLSAQLQASNLAQAQLDQQIANMIAAQSAAAGAGNFELALLKAGLIHPGGAPLQIQVNANNPIIADMNRTNRAIAKLGQYVPGAIGSLFSAGDALLNGLEGNRTEAITSLAAAGVGLFGIAGVAKAAGTVAVDALKGGGGAGRLAGLAGRSAFGETAFRGLVQNRALAELSDAEVRAAFQGAPYALTNHAVSRLLDPRTGNLGIRTLNDVAGVLNKGVVDNAGGGLISIVRGDFGAIINPTTKAIVTFKPF
jgi:RHS repeat-associated protein